MYKTKIEKKKLHGNTSIWNAPMFEQILKYTKKKMGNLLFLLYVSLVNPM